MLTGGALLLVGVAWLQSLLGNVEFTTGGLLAEGRGAPRGTLTAIFLLLMVGLGVMAALVPLHGWLSAAMAASAPASALLHAVAAFTVAAFGMIGVPPMAGFVGLLRRGLLPRLEPRRHPGRCRTRHRTRPLPSLWLPARPSSRRRACARAPALQEPSRHCG